MKIVVASGYFNPLHIGHIKYLESAKKLGDKLIVIVNNDVQVGLKGSFPFMPERERVEIIKALRCVDEVMLSIDSDKTVARTLMEVNADVFAKGGDSTPENVPEAEQAVVKEIIFGVGGQKIQSSSTLCQRVNIPIR